MTKWAEIPADLEEYEAWLKKVFDYQGQASLARFKMKKINEAKRLAASEKKRFVEAD